MLGSLQIVLTSFIAEPAWEVIPKTHGRRVAAAAVFIVGFVFIACSGENKQLSRADVQLTAGDLRSFAASAKMLIDTCSGQNATQTFCQEQSELLSSKVEDALKQLDGHAADAEYERKQLEDIAKVLRDIVGRSEHAASTTNDAVDADRISSVAKTVEDDLRK